MDTYFIQCVIVVYHLMIYFDDQKLSQVLLVKAPSS